MNDKAEEPDTDPDGDSPRFSHDVGVREERMLKSRRQKTRSVWAGFGFFGLVGWSIVVPTLIGVAVGRWLDRTYPGERSWTLVFLVAGLTMGCFNAWRWIRKEHLEIEKEGSEDDNE